jgi:polyisoprenoid-binding protein YceI
MMITRTRLVVLMASLAHVASASARAQTALTVQPESRVILLGRSNVNSWSCASSTFHTRFDIDSSARGGSEPLAKAVVRLTVTVPVRSLDCGRKRMNDDMFKALKADSFPEIRYVLTSYLVDEQLPTADSVSVSSAGELTVGGKTRRVEFQVDGTRDNAGGLRGIAGARFLMTDFGIRPPTALFGTIRTKNAVEVRVEIRATATVVLAAPK